MQQCEDAFKIAKKRKERKEKKRKGKERRVKVKITRERDAF